MTSLSIRFSRKWFLVSCSFIKKPGFISQSANWKLGKLQSCVRSAPWRLQEEHRWRLKLPAYRLFSQPFIQAQTIENIKAPRHWPLWGEFTGYRWIPAQKANNAENVSIWWRQHGSHLGKVSTDLPTSFKITSMTPGKSCDWPNTSVAALNNKSTF